jgi:hypothetical protein
MKILTSLSEAVDWFNGLLQLPERRLTFQTLSGCRLSCQGSGLCQVFAVERLEHIQQTKKRLFPHPHLLTTFD